ncbi:MAG: alpha/beta hydrolase [Leptolyngbyaceae cyanobacterium CRU_2_3]|nr:alpha/beta hydrolase [Leptolyngbyaceae cyanobacterium CRU_2_3]
MSLPAISVPAKSGRTKGLLVILHGWGASAQDVAALASYLDLPDYQFLFPNAPFPHPYSPTGKMWYGLPSDYSVFSSLEFLQQTELQESRIQLVSWLQSLEKTTGIPLTRTILGGFSQGGAMTLDVGLFRPFAALMVLSGYLHPLRQPSELELAKNAPAQFPPILLVHGRQDRVVPLNAAHQARDRLQQIGAGVQYFEQDMGHEIDSLVLRHMQSFIEEIPLSTE